MRKNILTWVLLLLMTAVLTISVTIWYRLSDQPPVQNIERFNEAENSPPEVPMVVPDDNDPDDNAGLGPVVIWHATSGNKLPQQFKNDNPANTAFIELAQDRGLRAGDEVQFPVPQESVTYTGVISGVTVSAAGNSSYSGDLDESGQHKFLLTMGQSNSFASFNTPAGAYEMEARGSSGRLIPVKSWNARLDFDKPDYIIPERWK